MSKLTADQITPLGDRVLARIVEQKASDIIVMEASENCVAEVLKVGEGIILEDGSRRPVCVEVGDMIIFGRHTDTKVPHAEDGIVMFNEGHILATVSGDVSVNS